MEELNESRRGRGRPGFDDAEHILSFMTSRIRSGLNITQAAKGGLTIYAYETGAGGQLTLVERRLTSATLARRYSKFFRQAKAQFYDITAAFRAEGASVKSMAAPVQSAWFMPDKPVSRGRPRRKSKR